MEGPVTNQKQIQEENTERLNRELYYTFHIRIFILAVSYLLVPKH